MADRHRPCETNGATAAQLSAREVSMPPTKAWPSRRTCVARGSSRRELRCGRSQGDSRAEHLQELSHGSPFGNGSHRHFGGGGGTTGAHVETPAPTIVKPMSLRCRLPKSFSKTGRWASGVRAMD